jgi:hypothetical protein
MSLDGLPKRKIADDADAAVDAILRHGDQRQAMRGKSRRAISQAKRDAARTTMRIDVPPAQKEHLENIAAKLQVSVSQLTNRVIWEGLKHLTLEQLESELVDSRSMRYAKALPYPGDAPKGKTK